MQYVIKAGRHTFIGVGPNHKAAMSALTISVNYQCHDSRSKQLMYYAMNYEDPDFSCHELYLTLQAMRAIKNDTGQH